MLTKDRLKAMGLHEGAIRARETVHNGGWYSTTGEKLGWGDLSEQDFKNIQANLGEGELFVVLPEHASFWNFVTHHSAISGAFCKTKPEEQNPGQDYLVQHASYVITKDKVYGRYTDDPVSREALGNLIRSGK